MQFGPELSQAAVQYLPLLLLMYEPLKDVCFELRGEKGWFSGIWSTSFPLCPGEWDSEGKSDYSEPIKNPWRAEASQSPLVSISHPL